MAEIQIGDTVKAHYHSGTYIGKVIEDRGERYLIEVLAVIKHPLQGDIHNIGKVEDVFFHERKALYYKEKMNVKKPAVKAYHGPVPAYGESLKKAVEQYKESLMAEDSPYHKMALENLQNLENHYYVKHYYGIK